MEIVRPDAFPDRDIRCRVGDITNGMENCMPVNGNQPHPQTSSRMGPIQRRRTARRRAPDIQSNTFARPRLKSSVQTFTSVS